MKIKDIIAGLIIVFGIFVLCITLAKCKSVTDSIIQYTPIQVDEIVKHTTDSLQQNFKIEKLLIEQEYNKTIDSLTFENNNYKQVISEGAEQVDSLNEELLTANYKLERIKYYNSIATGNQLKYLRGWINRVLNQK